MTSFIHINKIKSIFLSSLFIVIGVGLMAQTTKETLTKKEKKIFDAAKTFAKSGELDKSNDKFLKLLSAKPDFTEAYLRLASNYYQQKFYLPAEENFKKAINLQPDFDPEMYYSLAMVQTELKKHAEAADQLDTYIIKAKDKPEKVKKATKQRDNLRFITFALKHPVPFQPINMGDSINSENSEYSPALSLDGSKMIYTRNVKKPTDFTGQEDFFISEFDGTRWSESYALTDINTLQNEGAFALAANGKYMVFTACDRRDAFGSCDLYYSMLMNGEWTMPVNMGHKVNSAAWDSQPTLSADGRTLIFASKRLGTLGGSDIFITQKDEKDAWTIPVNIGPTINTEGDDESPFLHPDGVTLYLRSNGRPGMGKHDLYFSKKNDTTDLYQTPVNLGYPINTYGDEGSLTVSLDGTMAYYASDSHPSDATKYNNLDIYSFELYEDARPKATTFIKGQVTDAITGKSVKAAITILDLKTKKVVFKIQTDENGEFISGITVGKNYVCIAENKLYTYHAENFDLTDVKVFSKPYNLDIKLQPIPKKETIESIAPIILQNIFFNTGSADLLPESSQEIALISNMMSENKNISIQIIGHTDDVGNDADNQLLSEQRAKAVATAIIAKGISPDRIQSIGKGETQPIAENTSDEGRRKNRRTEMLVKIQ